MQHRSDRARVGSDRGIPPWLVRALAMCAIGFGVADGAAAADAGWERLSLLGGATYAWRYLPASVDAAGALPLVVFFHGLGSSPEGYGDYLVPSAETAGLVLLLPKSLDAAGWGDSDIPALNDALVQVGAELTVDQRRIGLAGHSAGAAMAYLLAYSDTTINAVFAMAAPYYRVDAIADPTWTAPIRMCYGSLDPNYTGGSEAALRARWTALGVAQEEEVLTGYGHSDVVLSGDAITRGFAFLVAHPRPAAGGSGGSGSGTSTSGTSTSGSGSTGSGASGGAGSASSGSGGAADGSGAGSTGGSSQHGCGLGAGSAGVLSALVAGMGALMRSMRRSPDAR